VTIETTHGAALRDTIAEFIGFDPAEQTFRDNPYPHYARLRERAPIYRSPGGFWVLSRYADCTSVLRDERFGHPADPEAFAAAALLGGSADQRHFMLFKNPPEHTRLRALVREVFTPGLVNAMRPYVERTIAELLDAAEPGAPFDVIGGFSHPLSLHVICELLGIAADDRRPTMEWARDFLAGIDPTFALTAARHQARDAAFANLTAYFTDLVAHRRQRPGRDLISLVLAAGGDELDQAELVGIPILLFIAGHGTTTNLIGNGTLALSRHPRQRERYRTDPSVAATGLEELLRYDAPSQLTVRTALADVPLGGQVIRRDEQVIVLRGAANRDPAAFADPDRLDLARPDNRQLAFGHGIHRCVGAALARMEGRLALGALLDRAPDLPLVADRLQYRDSLLIRGLAALPITLS
jgi:hypothetical protein